MCLAGGLGPTSLALFLAEVPFRRDEFLAAMKGHKAHICGMNMLDHSFMFSAMPGIPVNRLAVKKVMSSVFGAPCRFPSTLIIALDSETQNPMLHRGALMSITAEELRHAYLLAVARDLCNPDFPAKDKLAWKAHLLSCPFEFRVLPTPDDRFWGGYNLRAKELKTMTIIARTAWQRLHEVASFRSRKEAERNGAKISDEDIAKLYQQHAEATDAEFLTTDFFKKVDTIWRRGVAIPEVKAIIQSLDNNHGVGSPLNNITTLYGAIVRAGSPDNVKWSFQCLNSLLVRGKIAHDDCSSRNLTGFNTGTKRIDKCWIDVFIFKKKLLAHLTSTVLDKLSFPVEFKTSVRQHFAGFDSYESGVNPIPGGAAPNLQWQTGLKASAHLFTKMREEMEFNTVYDGTIKTALANNKIPEEFMDYAKITAEMAKIRDALDDESKAADDKKAKEEELEMNKRNDERALGGGALRLNSNCFTGAPPEAALLAA